jgi:hypothetical protein
MLGMKLPCGFWCPRDPNESPDTSHGICDDCAQILQDQSDARHWDKVPSYVSNRKEYNQYMEKKYGKR